MSRVGMIVPIFVLCAGVLLWQTVRYKRPSMSDTVVATATARGVQQLEIPSELSVRPAKQTDHVSQVNNTRDPIQESRAVIAGMNGEIYWQPLNDPQHWRSNLVLDTEERSSSWDCTVDRFIGDDEKQFLPGSKIITGDSLWRDFEFEVDVTPISGGCPVIHFRISEDGTQFYALNLMLGWQVACISRVDLSSAKEKITRISAVNYPFNHNQRYRIQVALRGESITSYIDGKLVNQVKDDAFKSGPVALAIWESRVQFENPRIRHLE
jgi:hypothetical protein